MKKIFFLLLILIFTNSFTGYSQGLENFDNSNATSSYSDDNFIGEDGIKWYYIESRDGNGDGNNSGISLPALMLRQSSDGSKVYCETISGGIGNFTIKLYKGFTGGGNRQVELFINDVSKGTSTVFDDFDEHIFTVNDINISGNIVIRIDNITAKQVIVDDITWTAYTGGGNQPPVITNISNNPLVPTSSETVSVSANVTDTDGTVGAVTCYYGTTSGSLTNNVDMSFVSGSTYTTDTDIPTYTDGTTVYYEIYALDNESDATTSPEQNYLVTDPVTQPNAWINEFHYDNEGDDVNEFVEIVIESAGTYSLADFQIDLYNGNGGATYDSETADLFTIGDTEGDYSFYYWNPSSIQNGAPDGLALSYQGALLTGQFLSYEGSFAGSGGPADGITSTDIGVDENGSTPVGYSLQLKGIGDAYDLFNWVDPAPETPGAINNSQYFKSNYTNWTGAINDDWIDEDNWNNGVPDAMLTAFIPSGLAKYPTLTTAGNCDDLIMESDASLVGVDNLTVNGTAIIERTVNGYTTDYDGYHFLSAPVSSFIIAGSDFEPKPGTDDFFSWDEPTNYWLNFEDGLIETDFVVGKGYLVAYDPINPGSFTGNLNKISVEKNLTYTPGFGEGWNLLGNPFTSAIDWNLLTKTAGVYGSYYILNGTDNTYLSSNGSGGDFPDGHIPINNGFFVKTDATPSQSVTIAPSAQVHGSLGFLKSGNELVSENTLKISIANETYQNATYIQFRSDASVEFDNAIDAYKLFGTSDAPQIFTSLSDIEYSINCLPFSSDINQLPMGFRNRLASEYTISASGIESFIDDQVAFYLEDTETNDLIDLSVESYTFSAQNVNYNDRFILHFSGITSIEEEVADDEVHIYASGNSVYFRFDQLPKGKSIVSVFNTIGQQVYGGEIEQSTLSVIKLNNKPGIYVVRLQTSQGITTQKVLIN